MATCVDSCRPRQETHNFKTSLHYIPRPCIKSNTIENGAFRNQIYKYAWGHVVEETMCTTEGPEEGKQATDKNENSKWPPFKWIWKSTSHNELCIQQGSTWMVNNESILVNNQCCEYKGKKTQLIIPQCHKNEIIIRLVTLQEEMPYSEGRKMKHEHGWTTEASLKHKGYRLIFVNMKEFKNCFHENFLKIPMSGLHTTKCFVATSK